ncbi:Mu transposase C-terminal domain-containing protein [Pseudomonas sp. PP3]|uniref:Mu transposase C-terminal domain-containing protein n=1 Tax=Pseudomonas sp. PP3 TaxID=2815936 RepID=UPI001BB033E6|nr:Mu transposase C-terminal domain-containing protein [Pseudomonas sp. PP3]
MNTLTYHGEKPQAFIPDRARLSLERNAFVRYGDDVYRINQVLDFKTVVGIDVYSGRAAALPVDGLKPIAQERLDGLYVNYDMESISEEQWAIAKRRFEAIEPLLGDVVRTKAEIKARALLYEVDTATVYRWMDRYKSWGELLALIPRKRGWQSGTVRISAEADELLDEVIREYYLSKTRPTVSKAVSEFRIRAQARGIPMIAESTIRQRISRISDKQFLRGRGFADKARNSYTPSPGSFPGADFPLAVVQIDHTPIDAMVVDDVHRKSIGRLWLTLAIDVHSRMITGYYLAIDAPSVISVAMCVAHSIIPKEEWLIAHGIEGDWPVWGFPRVLHSDNGADFRSESLRKSCSNYGIENRFRPVKRPKYGGHIERLMGKFMQAVHGLPGTTFSNIQQREGIDSDAQAALTVSEFEVWLVREILKYNAKYHAKIFMSPLHKWNVGIFGGRDDTPAMGLPPRPADPFTIQRDFLPAYERTVQHYGVELDVTYYSEALRPWINAKDDSGKTRKFIFRRDPRDISQLWFYDPHLKQYFKIPVANQSFPATSVWEFRAAKKQAVEQGLANIDDDLIKRLIIENRELVESAKATTKKTRRLAQRQKIHQQNKTPALPAATPAPTIQITARPAGYSGLVDDLDDGFEDIL